MNFDQSEKSFSYLYSAESPYLTFTDSEVNKLRNNTLLLDNITNWYIFEDEVLMGFSILRKYENIIRSNLVEINLDKEFWYKPESLSYDRYGTTDLWYLILFVNNLDSPMKFNMSKCLVPSDSMIDGLIKIAQRESNLKISRDNPARIYKHILKDLNSPSIQVLPSDFDDQLYEITDLKDYEDITSDYLQKKYFHEDNRHIFEGILKNKFTYTIAGGENVVYENPRKEYSGFYHQLDNYYAQELMDSPNLDFVEYIQIEKKGYLRVYNTGTYHFRVYTNADFNMYINGSPVISYLGKQSKISSPYTKNLFEELSYNADFKRRNLDYWTSIHKSSKLIFDSTLNKNLLELSVPLVANTSTEVFHVDVPISNASKQFENEGDFIYYVDYYLPDEVNYHRVVLVLDIERKDGTHVTSTHNSLSDYIRKDEYTKITETLVFTRPSTLKNQDIKKITMYMYLNGTKNPSYYSGDSSLSTKIHVSKIKVYTYTDPVEMMDFPIYLDRDILYSFETLFQKEYNSPDIFNVKYKFEAGEYKEIPRGWFSIEAPEGGFNFPHALLSIYDNEDSIGGNDWVINRQLVYDEISISEAYDAFNILNGVPHRFNLKFYPEVLSEFQNMLRIVTDKNTRADVYKFYEDYSHSRLIGSNNYNQLVTDINLGASGTGIGDIDKYLMLDFFTNENTNKLDITLYANGNNTTGNIDYNDLKFNWNFNSSYPYELLDGVYELHSFTPLKNSVYKAVHEKNLKDDWILDMYFETMHEEDYLGHNYAVMPSFKGIFGLIMDFQEDGYYYMLVFNYNKNALPFLKNGLYRFAKDISLATYNTTQLHEFFMDRFELLTEVNLTGYDSDTIDTSPKMFKIMKRKNYILFSEDKNKKSFLQYKLPKDKAIYKKGRLGFFSHELDGIKISMNLWN